MVTRRVPELLIATLVWTLCLPSLSAEEWSRFRGPNGSGIASGPSVPEDLAPDKSVVWVTELPFGRSSPVLTADRVFLTAIEEGQLVTLALDRASGGIVWKSSLERLRPADLHQATDSATSTPVTDGENVYAFFHESGLVSYDAAGRQRWHLEMGPFRNFYGIGASPILAGDTLLLVCDQVQGSFLLAVDKDSGEELWRQSRAGKVESYATPLLYPDAENPDVVIVLGSKWIDAYAIDNGDTVWATQGVGYSPISSPVLAGDLLFMNTVDHAAEPPPEFSTLLADHDKNDDQQLERPELEGSWMQGHFGYIDVDGDGAVSEADWDALHTEVQSDDWGVYAARLPADGGPPEFLWNNRTSVAYIPTTLHVNNVLYMTNGNILTSFDPVTGEVLKRGRIKEISKDVYASPVAVGDNIYIGSLDGKLAVLSAEAEWEVLAVGDFEEEIFASPAIADGHLYLRTRSKLYSFAGSDEAGSGEAGQGETGSAQ